MADTKAQELNKNSSSLSDQSALPQPKNHEAKESTKADEEKEKIDNPPETPQSQREKKKKQKEALPPGAHRVSFTVTIAKAIATDEEDLTGGRDAGSKKKRRVVEAPRAQNYFHYEYQLLPNADDLVKTDVVTFGIAAKIYTERQEPKVLKTWKDGNLTWVAWTHCHSVIMTEDLLKQLFNHSLVLHVWDTKDKMSTRARFDRPKAFRLPHPKPGEDAENVGGVKGIVMKQSRNYEKLQPKKCCVDRPLPGQPRSHGYVPLARSLKKEEIERENLRKKSRGAPPISNTVLKTPIKPHDEDLSQSFSRLTRLAGAASPVEAIAEPKEGRESREKKAKKLHQDSTSAKQEVPRQGSADTQNDRLPLLRFATCDSLKEGSKEPSILSQSAAAKCRRSCLKSETAQSADAQRKLGFSLMTIKMNKLFAGLQSITERLSGPTSSIEDLFCTISINGALMSEDQQKSLNPLVLRVVSATNMPDTPLSYDELKLRCQPAYISYKLFDGGLHRSVGREQNRNIYWDDINVFLTGVMDPAEVREFLSGPPLSIEVHDRDRIPGKSKLKPALFGDDLQDEKISNVGTVTSRRTVKNAFSGRDHPWDPHGIAQFDLSDLLLGHQFLYLKSPIMQCAHPDLLGTRERSEDGKMVGVAGALDGPVDVPFVTGHYMDTGAMMKVKVEIARPLVTPAQLAENAALPSTASCPFARLVYKFNFKNVEFLKKVMGLINDINARSLQLDALPAHVVESALSTYKLSPEQQESPSLDIVTGFQVMDGEFHLFVLEGLREGAIQTLREKLPKPEQEDVLVLFHSDMTHQHRLYGPLDVDLCCIKLHEPLDLIVQQSLLYVRDMCPKPCFEALVKLNELIKVSKLRDAVRNKLFPSAEMVVSMSKEFGVPIMPSDLEAPAPEEGPEKSEVKAVTSFASQTSRDWTPIDNYNADYIEHLHERENDERPTTDYCRRHKEVVKQRSIENGAIRCATVPPRVRAVCNEAHNYSTQARNSTEQANKLIRQMIREEAPDTLFTRCPDYHHSMTVQPVDVESVLDEEKKSSKRDWRTAQGWSYPGHKTMIASNKHPQKLDIAREEELKSPWKENILHQKDRPLLQRDPYTWQHRHVDFNNWSRPLAVFGHDDPVTIQDAGDKLEKIRKDKMAEELDKWKSKLVVNDPKLHTHRCLPATELTAKGANASNQVSKLQGLLKDVPTKVALKKAPMAIHEIPPLAVVANPSVDRSAREEGRSTQPALLGEMDNFDSGFFPGPHAELSWILDRNQIPVRDYERKKYKEFRGQDFNVFHHERNFVHKRSVNPLTDNDYSSHLFKWGASPVGSTFYMLPNLKDFKQSRLRTNDSGFAASIPEVPV